jgi:L-threonylcarbamoyladenylate synthase
MTTDFGARMTEIMKMSKKNVDLEKIKLAAREIRGGKLVVFPTETVYGIGADAFNTKACRDIFRVKNRAADNPLIVHISDFEQLDAITYVDGELREKIRRLWPNPITFILKRKKIPDVVTAGMDTVAVRMPNNRIALSLIRESHTPIAAPSANISTFPSATEAKHAIEDFNGKVSVIIDGGRSKFGIESTVIDVSRKPYRLLRPGAFEIGDAEKVLGDIIIPKEVNKTVNKAKVLSPGMKYRHYSPRKPLFLFENFRDMKAASDYLLHKNLKFAVISPEDYAHFFYKTRIITLGSIENPISISKNLFRSFRRLDIEEVDFGLISKMRLKKFDLAVINRLEKAAGKNKVRNLKKFIESFH